ncbi:hypothetical protein SELMODRAFT_439982 [Selaginella moellendorffii]|uniref:RING-type E3 ubiquitin transferase n=1 Tax=Selaginella moellendorffii TaxID=88036 RepID=D8R8P4_SELML|nr:hypothetical protein SELMODRAFT_439982 [Selaginella moellendorffii]
MGRTKGDGARGKGRPSSSSLAAALSQGNASAGFGGYVGSARIDAGPSEETYASIDGETAANLRRLSKKDPITKIKALAALTAFFQERPAAEVLPVLPSWVFEYKKLVFDNSRQTREATHKAMTSLATTVGRSLAPHLRSLMGAWWMSHFDPFFEVSDAAKQALQAAFPGQKKRLEALTFCATDILVYIDDNLKLTPQTISDKSTPAEESAEKYERVISSTLLSLSALLTILFTSVESETGEERATTNEMLVTASAKLFRDHKMFQGLAKSGKSRTRSAVYQAIQVYIQHVPHVLPNDNMEVAAKFILGTFQEKDAGCHQAMWDLILVFTQRFPQTWESSSIRKIVQQRFWAFLRHGCYGSQQVSYPCLLPLLSLIPPAALSPPKGYFVDFFTNLWKGCEEASWTFDQGMLLLNSTKECFMWLLSHEKRFLGAEDSSLQPFFTESVLFGILWKSYVQTNVQRTSSLLLSDKFIEEIGKCIVDIVGALDNNSLSAFWDCLREECSALFLANNSQVNDRVLRFFLIFDSFSDLDKRSQIFNKVVKPFVADGFGFIKNSEKPEAVNLFTGLVGTYGLHVFDLLASQNWKGRDNTELTSSAVEDVFSSKHLQYLFRNELLPWSVSGEFNKLKVYVLLTFLEDEMFFREWDYVLTYFSDVQDSSRISILASLIKTLQSRCSLQNEAYKLERWKSPKIDEAVLGAMSNFQASAFELIRTTLEGVLCEGCYLTILSKGTVIRVMEEFLRSMVLAVYKSKNEAAILLAVSVAPSSIEEGDGSTETLERAKASIDTLLACWPSLRYVDGINELVIGGLGIIFCLYWTYVQPVLKADDEDDDNEESLTTTTSYTDDNLAQSLLQARKDILTSCAEFSGRRSLYEKLMSGVRKTLLEDQPEEFYNTAAYWVLDTLHLTCRNSEDRQGALDCLLASADYWPFWSTGARSHLLEAKKHHSISATVLEACARSEGGSRHRLLLDNVLDTLFPSAAEGDPYLRALLGVLRALIGHHGPFGRQESEMLFAKYLSGSSSSFLPHVLEAMMPSLIKRKSDDTLFPSEMESKICDWLNFALEVPNFTDNMQWMQVAVACFPLDSTGGVTALLSAGKADISEQQRNLLLSLFRKQSGIFVDLPAEEASNPSVQVMLARLIAPAVAYCWQNFGLEDWTFILRQLRKWIEDAVVHSEEYTEAVAAMMSDDGESKVVKEDNDMPEKLLGTGVTILSLTQSLKSFEKAAGSRSLESLEEAQWSNFETRAVDNVFRVFLATGLAEALASANDDLRQDISLQRSRCSYLWDRVAELLLTAPVRVRETAVRAADLWGLGTGGISALYALLFSPHPLPSLQWVAYKFLSTEPLQHQAVSWKPVVSSSTSAEDDPSDSDLQVDTSFDFIRPELLTTLGTPASKLFGGDTSSLGHYFLAWSLFLTHLQVLGTSSEARDRLLQYVKDSDTPSSLLDCLFRHIPTKRNVKKEDLQLSPVVEAVKRSAGTASVSFAVDGLLWGGGNTNDFAVIAGAIYGLILRVLPACVQTWFAGLREKGAVAAIEAFTADYCSPRLLAEEFNQVQAAAIAEENFIFKANRSLREVTVIYKKEEAAMDMTIKLPSCYPLKAVEVDCGKRLGISETRMRKWILSMASFLRNQNGSLSEAVLIWKKNVDREFDGVEECPICYSIIHTSNHSLPRLACKTCRHKFHGACSFGQRKKCIWAKMWEALSCCPEELLESSASNVVPTTSEIRGGGGGGGSLAEESSDGHEQEIFDFSGENIKDQTSLSHYLHILVKDDDNTSQSPPIQPDLALEGSSFQTATTTITTTNATDNLDCISTSIQEFKDHGSSSSSSGLLEDLAGVTTISIPSAPLPPPPSHDAPSCDHDHDQIVIMPSSYEPGGEPGGEENDPITEFMREFPPIMMEHSSVIHHNFPSPLSFHHNALPPPHPAIPFLHRHPHPWNHQLYRSLSTGNLPVSPHFPLGFLSSPISRSVSSIPAATSATAATAAAAAASSPGTPDDPAMKVGRYSPEERKVRIDRYRQKRSERNYIKKIKYACRKTLADSRPRIRGRFAKNQDAGLPQMKRKLDDDDDDECDILMGDEEDYFLEKDVGSNKFSVEEL